MEDFVEQNGHEVNRIRNYIFSTWKNSLFFSSSNLMTQIQELCDSSECLFQSESYKSKNYFNDQLVSQSKIKVILQIMEQYLQSGLNFTDCFPSDSKRLIESLSGDVFSSQDPNDVLNVLLYVVENTVKEMKIKSTGNGSVVDSTQNSQCIQSLIRDWQVEHVRQFLELQRKRTHYQQLKCRLNSLKRRFIQFRDIDTPRQGAATNNDQSIVIDHVLESVDIQARNYCLTAQIDQANEQLDLLRKKESDNDIVKESIANTPNKFMKNEKIIQFLWQHNCKRREQLLELRNTKMFTDCKKNLDLSESLKQIVSESNGFSKSVLKSVKGLNKSSFKCTADGVPLDCLPQNIMMPLTKSIFDNSSNSEITIKFKTPEDLLQFVHNLHQSIQQSTDRRSSTSSICQKIEKDSKLLEYLKTSDSQLQEESQSKLGQRFDRLDQIHQKFSVVFADIRKLILETNEMPALTIQCDSEN